MKSTDVLTLLNAGFTREEILAMDAEPEAASASDHSSDLLSADTPSVSPSSQPAEAVPSSPAVEQEGPQDPTQQILQQLTELVKSVQANNRSQAEMGAEIIEPRQQAINTLKSLGGLPDNNK